MVVEQAGSCHETPSTMTSPSLAPSTSEPTNFSDTVSPTKAPTPNTSPTNDPDHQPDHPRAHPEPGPGLPTRVDVSTMLPTTGATKQDDGNVAEVTTYVVIENTDPTSLAPRLVPKLVLVTGNEHITNNAVLSKMDASFQKLGTVSGNLDGGGDGLS